MRRRLDLLRGPLGFLAAALPFVSLVAWAELDGAREGKAAEAAAKTALTFPAPNTVEVGDGWATIRWTPGVGPIPTPTPVPPGPTPAPTPTPPPVPPPPAPEVTLWAALVLPDSPSPAIASLRRNAAIEGAARDRKVRLNTYLESESDLKRLGLDRHIGLGANQVRPPCLVVYGPGLAPVKGPVANPDEAVALLKKARGK